MSNYIKTTNFAIKDTYASGDPRKIAKGADVDTEYNNIATAVTTKEDVSNKGIANGYAGLDSGAKVATANLPALLVYTNTGNVFSVAQSISGSGTLLTITDSSAAGTSQLSLSATSSSNGANIKLLGNGATTPSKTIRTTGGALQVVNDAYSSVIWTLTDAGAVTAASFAGNGASLTSLNASNLTAGTVSAGLVPSGAVTQYAASIKGQNITGKAGIAVTLSNGANPSGGADGDVWFRYN